MLILMAIIMLLKILCVNCSTHDVDLTSFHVHVVLQHQEEASLPQHSTPPQTEEMCHCPNKKVMDCR